jgi:hypothetical protein
MSPKLSLLAVLGAAASTALGQIYVSPGLGYFTLNTVAPTDETIVTIDPINADGGKFWIGRPTAQTCSTLPEICAHYAASTVLSTTSQSLDSSNTTPPTSLSLATLSGRETKVQHVYVAADGTLSYTEPGADAPGDAESTDGFLYTPEPQRTAYGVLKLDGRDWWACSTDSTSDVWQISSAASGTATTDGCSVISISTRPYWQGVNVDFYNTTES